MYDFFLRCDGGRMAELRRVSAGSAHGHVVEIGCGTGLNFEYYDWQRVDRLDATEPDPFMLKRARHRLEALPGGVRERVHLHEVTAEDLPFGEATFDAAVSTLVLCTVRDPSLAARELHRVLKPGARLYLVEHVRGSGPLATAQRLLQPLWGWFAAGCHLDRNTEVVVAASGLRLTVQERFKLAPLLPAVRGFATKEQERL